MHHKKLFERVKKLPKILPFGNKCIRYKFSKKIDVYYNEFMNSLPLPAFETDENANITYLNTKAYELFGYGVNEKLIGKSTFDFAAESEKKSLKEKFEIASKSESGINNYFWGVKKNGELFPVLVHSIPNYCRNKFIGLKGVILEVTHQKNIFDFLQHTELKYLSFIKHSNDAICLISEHQIVLVNEKFEKLFGYKYNEINSHNFNPDILVTASSLAHIKDSINKLRNGEIDNSHLHFTGLTKDSQELSLEINLAKIQLNSGWTIQAIIKDNSEKKKAEDEYLITKAIMHASINQSPAGILIFNQPDFKLRLANNTALEIFGIRDKEKYIEEFEAAKFKVLDFRGNLICNSTTIEKVLDVNESVKNESMRVLFENNNEKWVLINSAPVYDNNKNMIAVVVVLLDTTHEVKTITKLKTSEKRLKSIYDNTSLGIFRISKNMNLEMMNPALVKMLGYSSEAELKTDSHLISLLIKELKTNIFQKTHDAFEFETSVPRADGLTLTLRISGTCYHDSALDFQYCDGLVEDISKRKQAEKDLISAMKKAEAAEKIKSDFLAQISHEIRTPINTILGFTGLLEEEIYHQIPEELKMSFDFIYKAGRRLIRTIDLLLLMSELQTKTYESNPRVFDVHSDVVEPLFADFISTAREKGLSFIVNNKSSNNKIKADYPGVKQIISHLFDNAIKYTENGSIYVEIFSESDDYVTIKIKDTGIGISEKYLKTIFKPFSQEDSGYTRKFDGNGLGLAVVSKLAEMNNASIEVESIKGEGTEFKVKFSLG